jgi:dTDP-4-dehydrorhamnose reductase
MQSILITGSNGQLGNEFKVLAGQFPLYNFIFTDVAELDITRIEDVNAFILANPVNYIINCAAYTNVDKAETDRELAWQINVMGPHNLAEAASLTNALLVHVSTDYVFDGKGNVPYTEKDKVNPQGYYGVTKLEGEKAVLNSGARAMIIRTSWLYSSFGHNFVKTMRKYGAERGELKVVADQYGTPTYAADLAGAIMQIITQHKAKATEIYHYSNLGNTTWYGFATEIIRLSGIDCKVHPISTEEYPLPAPRPGYSVLNKNKIQNEFDLYIPEWQKSLEKCIKLL